MNTPLPFFHIPPDAAWTAPFRKTNFLRKQMLVSNPALARMLELKAVTVTLSAVVAQPTESIIDTRYVPTPTCKAAVVSPVFHKKRNGARPPTGVAVIVAVVAPKHTVGLCGKISTEILVTNLTVAVSQNVVGRHPPTTNPQTL
jgi:hypothetical protein